MSVVYNTLRRGFRLAIDLFYADIRVTGRSRVPDDGPVIFVANHPNSVMDGVILTTQFDRQLHYLAKSELFTNPFVARLFRACGVIPLHKNPGGNRTNDQAFESAFELLESGRCLGIFPEGENAPEREILNIKTGAARIALGAEARNDYQLDLPILPVGLNFENRDRFMSRVVVRVGEPMTVSDHASTHRRDAWRAVEALTDEIEASLHGVVATMKDEQTRDLAERIERIYGRRLLEQSVESDDRDLLDDEDDLVDDTSRRRLAERLLDGVKQSPDAGEADGFDQKLRVQEWVAEVIDYYDRTAPTLVDNLRRRVWQYVDHLEQFRIQGDLLDGLPDDGSRAREALKLTLYAVVFAIPAAWGFLHNAIPDNLSRLSAVQAPDEPMRAVTGLLSGLVLFSGTYAATGWAIWSYSIAGVWLTAVYLMSLPVTGFFFLRYRRQLSRYRNRILTRGLLHTRKGLLQTLLDERQSLLEVFDELRDHYQKVQQANTSDGEAPPPPDVTRGWERIWSTWE